MYMYQGPTEKYFARIGKLIDITFQRIESGLKSLFHYMYSDASVCGEQAETTIFNSLWFMIAFTIWTIAFTIWDIIIIIEGGPWIFLLVIVVQLFSGSPYIVALTRKIIKANLIPNLIVLIRGQKNG